MTLEMEMPFSRNQHFCMLAIFKNQTEELRMFAHFLEEEEKKAREKQGANAIDLRCSHLENYALLTVPSGIFESERILGNKTYMAPDRPLTFNFGPSDI